MSSSNGAVLSPEKLAELRAAARGVRRDSSPLPMGLRVTRVPSAPQAAASRPTSAPAAPVDPGSQPLAEPTSAPEAIDLVEAATPIESAAPVTARPAWSAELEDLLAKASTSPNVRTQALGEKVRTMLADLAGRVAAESAERRVAAEIAELEQQLAAKRDQLRGLRRPTTAVAATDSAESAKPGTSASLAPSPKEVRAWARANGVPCNAVGRVPQHVVDAYLAAAGRGATG